MSARQTLANQANSRASTGPKTRAGKARAAANARWHGLTRSVLADAHCSAEVEALARSIAAADHGRPDLLALARRIAEAQLDLVRIRQTRHKLLAPDVSADRLAALLAIERYERRALSRRKFAIRAFDIARQ